MDIEWKTQGKCRSVGKPDIFFSDPSTSEGKLSQNEAKKICQECPVISKCLEYALVKESYGIWGGLNERERELLKRRQESQSQTSSR